MCVDAMETEVQALKDKETYEEVPRPSGIRPIPCKLGFKWNAHEARAKARIVVMGCYQDTSHLETFAPTASHTTTKMIVFNAARRSWRLEAIKIDARFLNGEAPPDAYVLPPPGYRVEGMIWKLKKSLYGLATSPRTWFLLFVTTLRRYRLVQSTNEPCVFSILSEIVVVI